MLFKYDDKTSLPYSPPASSEERQCANMCITGYDNNVVRKDNSKTEGNCLKYMLGKRLYRSLNLLFTLHQASLLAAHLGARNHQDSHLPSIAKQDSEPIQPQ